jgi:hypothetical protein
MTSTTTSRSERRADVKQFDIRKCLDVFTSAESTCRRLSIEDRLASMLAWRRVGAVSRPDVPRGAGRAFWIVYPRCAVCALALRAASVVAPIDDMQKPGSSSAGIGAEAAVRHR